MARAKREVSENGVYRISLSGNDGEIFKKEEDYDEFKALLERYFQDGKSVLGYSLTGTGADIAVMVGEQSIGMAMKPLLTSYARYFNRTYERSGKVFHDRYKSEPVTDERLDEVLAELDNVDGAAVSERVSVKKAEAACQAEEKESKIKREEKKMDFWLL